MKRMLSNIWMGTVVFGPAIIGATVAAMAFRGHHVLASIFEVAFGYAGLYLGLKFAEALSGEKLT